MRVTTELAVALAVGCTLLYMLRVRSRRRGKTCILTLEVGRRQDGGGHLREMHERLGDLSWLKTNDEAMHDMPRVEVVPRAVGFVPPVDTISAACEEHRPSIVHFAMHGDSDPGAFEVDEGGATLGLDAIRQLRGLEGCFIFSGACRTGTQEIAEAFLAAGAVGYMAPQDRQIFAWKDSRAPSLGEFKYAILVRLSELAATGGLSDGQRAGALITEVLAAPESLCLSPIPRRRQMELAALASFRTWSRVGEQVIC